MSIFAKKKKEIVNNFCYYFCSFYKKNVPVTKSRERKNRAETRRREVFLSGSHKATETQSFFKNFAASRLGAKKTNR